MVARILSLGLLFACLPQAHAGGTAAVLDSLFRWGEYDSLEALSTRLGLGAGDFPPDLAAKIHVYLGVAALAKGGERAADTEFTRALDLDSGMTLDSFYVSRDIFRRFQETKARIGATSRSSPEQEREPPSGSMPAPIVPALPVSPRPSTRLPLWPAGLAAVGGSGLFAVAYFAGQQADRHYRAYVRAATVTGDRDAYASNRAAVRWEQEVEVFSVAGGLALSAAAAAWSWRAWSGSGPLFALSSGGKDGPPAWTVAWRLAW